jgi:hypothetical protein
VARFYQLELDSISPELAQPGDIIVVRQCGLEGEGIIIETGSICEGLFPGIFWVDLGRDAAHVLNYAVAHDLYAKGQLFISRDGVMPEYDEP